MLSFDYQQLNQKKKTLLIAYQPQHEIQLAVVDTQNQLMELIREHELTHQIIVLSAVSKEILVVPSKKSPKLASSDVQLIQKGADNGCEETSQDLMIEKANAILESMITKTTQKIQDSYAQWSLRKIDQEIAKKQRQCAQHNPNSKQKKQKKSLKAVEKKLDQLRVRREKMLRNEKLQNQLEAESSNSPLLCSQAQ